MSYDIGQQARIDLSIDGGANYTKIGNVKDFTETKEHDIVEISNFDDPKGKIAVSRSDSVSIVLDSNRSNPGLDAIKRAVQAGLGKCKVKVYHLATDLTKYEYFDAIIGNFEMSRVTNEVVEISVDFTIDGNIQSVGM